MKKLAHLLLLGIALVPQAHAADKKFDTQAVTFFGKTINLPIPDGYVDPGKYSEPFKKFAESVYSNQHVFALWVPMASIKAAVAGSKAPIPDVHVSVPLTGWTAPLSDIEFAKLKAETIKHSATNVKEEITDFNLKLAPNIAATLGEIIRQDTHLAAGQASTPVIFDERSNSFSVLTLTPVKLNAGQTTITMVSATTSTILRTDQHLMWVLVDQQISTPQDIADVKARTKQWLDEFAVANP